MREHYHVSVGGEAHQRGLYNKQSSRMGQFVVKICTVLCKHHVRGEQQRSVLRSPSAILTLTIKQIKLVSTPFWFMRVM